MLRFLVPALLLLASVSARALPVLLSNSGAANGSSQGYGSVYADGIDGNRDGAFANGSVWHTNSPDGVNAAIQPPAAVTNANVYEVNLGAMYYLDRVMIWPRTDVLQGTVTKFALKVYNDANALVFNQSFLPSNSARTPWGTTALRGIRGRKVRLERLDTTPNFLTFAEFEVWGSVSELPVNLALNKPVTAPTGGAFSTTLTAGNDGDIDNDYAHVTKPIFHSNIQALGQTWTVDLGPVQQVDYVQLYNRGDSNSTPQAKLSLRDAANAEVWSQIVDLSNVTKVRNGQQFDLVVDVPGTMGARYVRLETTQASYLAFAEVEVFGPVQDVLPPLVAVQDPAPASLLGILDQTEVTFSEDVTGVNGPDLLVNGVPAVSATALSARRYLFGFTQPAGGTVAFTWAAASGIQDAAGNALNAAASTWSVTLDPTLPAPRPYLSEFLSNNKGGLKDADGDTPDWIEITNPGPTPVNLAGWRLTDNPLAPARWTFPSILLLPAQPLVVFASAKNRAVSGAELHTNFKLDSDGGSLLLIRADGVTVASRIDYGPQEKNISSGRGRTLAATPLLDAGAPGRLLVPTGTVAGWTAPGFNDSAWTAVTTGIGYDVSNGQGASGPLGFWNFNDPAVPTTAADASGNGRPGTIATATYTADASGRSGVAGDRALSFAGNGAVSIAAAQTGAFDSIVDRNAVTISLWVYGDAALPTQTVAFWAGSDTAGGGARQLNAHLPWSDSVIYWDTAGCCDGAQTRVSIGEPNPANFKGRWNHYAFVKNGDTKEIWQNGQRILSAQNTTPFAPFRSLFIGGQTAAGLTGYRGLIDDFAIWDGALGGSQIQAIAAGGSPLAARKLTPLITTDVAAQVRNVNASALLRLPFTIADPAALDTLVLRVNYDDGFVAWLNGVEVARRQAPSTLAWNSTATTRRRGGDALTAEDIELSTFAAILRPGANVLAFQALNATAADSEFLLRPVLLGGSSAAGRFFTTPTPGVLNGSGYTGLVGDTNFAPRRGFYDAPFDVTVTCSTPGATVITTTDGSEPSLTNGSSASVIHITGTTTLRARAFLGTLAPSNIDTHTYLFLNQVAAQSRPASAADWGGAAPDFEMDSRVITGQPAGYTLRDSLTALPTLSLTADPAGLWGPSGIYVQSGGRGDAYERPVSAEWLLPDGVEGFHVSAGLKIHGNISRDKGFTAKHGFALKFRSDYGDTKLNYPLFPDSPTDQFDSLILRAGSTDTWPCAEWGTVGLGLAGEQYQRWARPWSSYIRDQWSRDAHLAMGQPAAHGRFCHIYLNGKYWGLYNVTEELSQEMLASQGGGEAADWDIMADFNELFDGQRTAWDQLQSLAGAGLATDAAVLRLLGKNPDGTPNATYPVLLDLDSIIDYFILHIYIGADDWPNHNWYAARNSRSAVPDGFKFLTWDQEISNESVLYGRTSWGPIYAEANAGGTSSAIYSALRANAEFRLRFADRIQRHLFNGGALGKPANLARWAARKTEIDRALVAESARWGDARRPSQPYRRETEWLQHMSYMDGYWNDIPATALQRFISASLYPAVSAPVPGRPSGPVNPGATLTLTNPNTGGALLFTLDGSDPRLTGGSTSATAQTYSAALPVSAGKVVKSRVLKDGVWSALVESAFTAPLDADGDGLPDAWELAHTVTDPDADPDADGQTNLAEYTAGTDPQDAASNFALRSVEPPASGGIRLTWDAAPGRQYTVQSSPGLVAATWTTRAAITAAAAERRLEITLPQTPAREFYRIVATVP